MRSYEKRYDTKTNDVGSGGFVGEYVFLLRGLCGVEGWGWEDEYYAAVGGAADRVEGVCERRGAR